MKIKIFLISFIIFTLTITGCTTCSIDSTCNPDGISSMDSLYISGITIHADDAGKLKTSLLKNCCFSLRKRSYRVASFIDTQTETGDFTYHAQISLYCEKYGDVLDPKISTTLFFDIKRRGIDVPVAVIRLTSQKYNIHDIADQVAIAEALAKQVENLAGK